MLKRYPASHGRIGPAHGGLKPPPLDPNQGVTGPQIPGMARAETPGFQRVASVIVDPPCPHGYAPAPSFPFPSHPAARPWGHPPSHGSCASGHPSVMERARSSRSSRIARRFIPAGFSSLSRSFFSPNLSPPWSSLTLHTRGRPACADGFLSLHGLRSSSQIARAADSRTSFTRCAGIPPVKPTGRSLGPLGFTPPTPQAPCGSVTVP